MWILASALVLWYSVLLFLALTFPDRLARMSALLFVILAVPAAFLALSFLTLRQRERGTTVRVVGRPGPIRLHHALYVGALVLVSGTAWILYGAWSNESATFLRFAYPVGALLLITLGIATWAADTHVVPRLPFRVAMVQVYVVLCSLSAAVLTGLALVWP